MTLAAFLTFAALQIAIVVSPGPSFVVTLQSSMRGSFRTGLGVALGLGLGSLVWASMALSGLALLFELAPALLTFLKLIGAAFLIWIGIQLWRNAGTPLPTEEAAPQRSFTSAVRLGLTTQLANPKAAIYFGAVFVGLMPAEVSPGLAALVLATIFVIEAGWYIIVARFFSLSAMQTLYRKAKTGLERAFGIVIGSFGIRIALD